jgi:hypothetical protein
MALEQDDVQACLIGLVQALIAKGVITMDEWNQFYIDGSHMVKDDYDLTTFVPIDDANVRDHRHDH